MSTSTNPVHTQTVKESKFNWWDYAGPLGIGAASLGLLSVVTLIAIAGLSISPLIWYLARAAGMTTYVLLWLSVVSGIAMSMRLKLPGIDQALLLPIHRLSTELSLVFLVLHGVSLAFDPTVSLGMLGVVLPFMSSIRQPWTDIGIISAYLLVGITASFGVRTYIGSQTWRRLHFLTFPLWLLAVVHAIGAGSDSGTLWAALIYLLTIDVLVFLVAMRILTRQPRRQSAARSDSVARDLVPQPQE